MCGSLLDLLFSEYRRKVLSLLLTQPEQAFHVREIARRTATQAGTLHKELNKLAQGGILLWQQQGNQICYRANPDCLIFPELATIFRKTSGGPSVCARRWSNLTLSMNWPLFLVRLPVVRPRLTVI